MGLAPQTPRRTLGRETSVRFSSARAGGGTQGREGATPNGARDDASHQARGLPSTHSVIAWV